MRSVCLLGGFKFVFVVLSIIFVQAIEENLPPLAYIFLVLRRGMSGNPHCLEIVRRSILNSPAFCDFLSHRR